MWKKIKLEPDSLHYKKIILDGLMAYIRKKLILRELVPKQNTKIPKTLLL